MPVQPSQLSIKQALENFDNGEFRASNLAILNALGYSSGRTVESSDTTPETFRGHIKSHATKELNEQKAKFTDWKQANILFQLTDKELNGQGTLLDNMDITPSLLKSYLFFAIELSGAHYSRTDLANIARQINRLFPMPVMIIFSYSDKLSFAIINRRRNKREEDRDVLGKVTLIYAVNYVRPHRGHIDILDSLSLSNLRKGGTINSFDQLHDAWEKIFNVELLNKRFYRELSNWYFWAREEVEFPDDIEKDLKTRNATSLIRLLARLIFCWFIKEKGLIPDNLFQEDNLRSVLNNLEPDKSTFYHAILQNLFFATLNQRMNTAEEIHRKFATDEGYPKNSNTYGVKNLYRYETLFNNPQDALALFQDIPFLNGGLFECLDKEDKTGKVQYLDGFSRNPKKRPKVPNELFFGDKQPVNLSNIYGDKNRRGESVRGLIHILRDYKFTIVENTPIEQEIALDPELLGQVFEGLLASYNPETKTTARKQTGSFYTPRPIVEYMVDESLKAYLIEATKTKIGEKNAKAGLEILFTYTEHEHAFNDDEVDILLEAIHSCKILDPACGSGAFPMGILQKLVYIIHKLDPDNAKWKNLQINKAGEIPDPSARDAAIEAINRDFEENEDDYGRKLYLIRNCLCGVDIQPIAIQISKLRFFISLICDQRRVSKDKPKNRGIRPLPNLETKFIAADTLTRLGKIAQLDLFANPKVEKLEKELESIIDKHFSANNRKDRLELQKRDQELRGVMVRELERTIANQETSQKLAEYDRYDPQTFANFFEPRWMFGQSVASGFDVVIGNPPYVQLQRDGGKLATDYRDCGYKTFVGAGDVYCLFYEQGTTLLKKNGYLCYITSNKWMQAGYGERLRAYFSADTNPMQLLDFAKFPVFENTTVDTNILLLKKSAPQEQLQATRFKEDFEPELGIASYVEKNSVKISGLTKDAWFIGNAAEIALKEKIEQMGMPLKEWDISIYRGIITGLNAAFIIDNETKEALIAEDPKSAEIIKPVLRGRDIKRYQTNWAKLWLIATLPSLRLNIDNYPAIKRHLLSYGREKLEQAGKTLPDGSKSRKKTPHAWFELQDTCAYHAEFEKEKIVWGNLSITPQFAFSKENVFISAPSNLITGKSIKYLAALLNSHFCYYKMRQIAYSRKQGYMEYQKIFVQQIPIPPITEENRYIALQLEELVEKILTITKNSDCSDKVARQIKEIEAQIDQFVYKLYRLTKGEIKIVEAMK